MRPGVQDEESGTARGAAASVVQRPVKRANAAQRRNNTCRILMECALFCIVSSVRFYLQQAGRRKKGACRDTLGSRFARMAKGRLLAGHEMARIAARRNHGPTACPYPGVPAGKRSRSGAINEYKAHPAASRLRLARLPQGVLIYTDKATGEKAQEVRAFWAFLIGVGLRCFQFVISGYSGGWPTKNPKVAVPDEKILING